MASADVLKEALAGVRRTLRENGFSAKGTTFHRKASDGNTMLMSIQRSVESNAAETLVTVNYGVYSARIGKKRQDEASAALNVWEAHWRERLSEGGAEKWMHVESTDSPPEIGMALVRAVNGVLPDLLAHSTDEALRDEWLSGRSPGLGKMQRLLFLAILVHEIGPREKLGGVLAELRKTVEGGIHERLVEFDLALAGVRDE
jgi:hypothetical protein